MIDETRKEYGLDQPFLVQYAKWFAGMAIGDMGKSYVSKRDVYETFIEKLPATIMLTVSSVLLTMLIAIPLGILSAVKHNKWSDYLIRFLSFIGNSMHPNLLLADEPTSALDVTVQKQVVEEMLMVREKFGTSILLVTHNMGVIRAMADKVLILHDGEIMEFQGIGF